MKFRKIIFSLLMIALCFSFCGCEKIIEEDNTLKIVATNFPCYDFARNIVKNNVNASVEMLLKPGVESHNYDPTPQDIIDIKNCDIFIYTGGESDGWIEKILDSIDTTNITVLKMSSFVTMQVEEFKEGMTGEHEENHEEEIEYDEHVWTSPRNAALIVEGFRNAICKVDPENRALYEETSEEYIDLLYSLDKEFRDVVSNANKKEIIFGDRFPLIYFVKEYGLDYYAAFPGCSSESEVSAKTLMYLKDKIIEDDIKYVFHIELSNQEVCETLKEETGCDIMLFHSGHNVTKLEFDSGVTYYALMKENVERLELALR